MLAITASANMYEFCTKQRRRLIEKTSLSSIMSADAAIKLVQLRPNGVPVVILSNGTAYAYDYKELHTWTLVSSTKYVKSTAWDRRGGRQRHSSSSASQSTQSQHHQLQQQFNPISQIELILNEVVDDTSVDETSMSLNREQREEEEAVYTYGHLETRMHAAILLDSPTEFRSSMIAYARRLADEGFRGKAEEFLKGLNSR